MLLELLFFWLYVLVTLLYKYQLQLPQKSSLISIEPKKKLDMLFEATNFPNFPDWVDQDFPNRISHALQDAKDENLVRRRILYLLRTTWYLDDQFTQDPEDCILLQRYPYEMAAVLGLLDWNESA